MTNEHNHPEHAQDPREPMTIAALLRGGADGELSDLDHAQLDAYLADHPEAESQIDFERALRKSCSRSMSGPSCPDALRAKVVAIAEAARKEDRKEDESYAHRIEASNVRTRSTSFWSRSPMMGIAAALLMVAAGTLIYQSTSFTNRLSAPSGLSVEQASYYNRVSDFVVREHTRCCDDTVAQAKLIQHDINQAGDYFSAAFEHQIIVPDMMQAAGEIEFFGGGDCHVPATARSGHLRFDAIGPDGEHIPLSLFISPNPGLLPMKEGITYRINSKACKDAHARLFAWVQDGVQYLLVSEADDKMCAKVRGLMKAPTTLGGL